MDNPKLLYCNIRLFLNALVQNQGYGSHKKERKNYDLGLKSNNDQNKEYSRLLVKLWL